MVPTEPATGITPPVTGVPRLLVTAIEVVPAPDASVTVTTATTPLAMTVGFMP